MSRCSPRARTVGIWTKPWCTGSKAAAKRAELPASLSTHWLRHAHASHALDQGGPISLVQATLGHASVATTGRYLHARPGDSSAHYFK